MKNTVIDWLLEDENPAIKYRTLTEICGKSHGECAGTYAVIWEQKSIDAMLRKQDKDGLWSNKDFGGFTSLRYLTAFAEHGLQKDGRLDRFVAYTIGCLRTLETKGELRGCVPPLTLRALVMLGYHDNSAVGELISKFAEAQLYDGGFMCKMKLDKKPGRKSCYKAAVAALLLYAECKKNGILPSNSDNLSGYFLKRDVFYSSDKSISFIEGKPGWRFSDNFFPVEPMRIGIPLIASALAALGVGTHPALTEMWELLDGKRGDNGRLVLDGTLTKQPCSFGKVGKENKWITFYALLANNCRL